jgi:hypothetical protein
MTSNSNGNEVGQALTLVAHIEGVPHSDQVTVGEGEPFTVEATATWCRLLRRGKKVVLLKPLEGSFAKAEVEIVSLSKFRNTYRIGFDQPVWHSTDRRRFPRFEVEVPVIIRRVAEREGEIQIEGSIAATRDLSAGGAWVKGPTDIASSTVVQVEMNLHGQACRTLGVVVRSDHSEDGFAVEFLDYIGSSRYVLSEFLRQAAA